MLCPQCQRVNPENARFCNACGTTLQAACPTCDHGNPPGSRFCNACGQHLLAPSSQAVPPVVPQPASMRQEPPPPAAERRQLTVMFCDLVGSTPLSERLDPEELREVVRAYQTTCAEVIQRHDGHIAQFLGDALLVYFGWPQAHEDDAQRAVRSGLGMIAAMRTLNARLQRDKGLRLTIRVGIHTGLVVVGEMGGSGHQEQLALGDTPNVAARLQGLAAPDTVLISESTFRLTAGYFHCQALGEQTLKGVSRPLPVHRVVDASGMQHRIEVAAARGLTPLVGREHEVLLLLARWTQVEAGRGQVVLLRGPGGIGKSRLVQVLQDHVASSSYLPLACRSSPYYQNSALFPVRELCQRLWHIHASDAPDVKLQKLERGLLPYPLALADTIPLLAPLLSIPLPDDRYPAPAMSPQRQRRKTLDILATIFMAQAQQQPVLFVLEDLHWTDPSTLEWLGLVIEQVPTASMYLLLTSRPEFQPPWSSHSHLTQLTLPRLPPAHIAHIATWVAGGKRLSTEVLQLIVEKTDGVPLFVEEMTKELLASGTIQDGGEQYVLVEPSTSLAIPATLQDLLMARLDRLGTAKAVAQLGATIGRTFAYDLLHAVTPLDEPTLQRDLHRLVEGELLSQRGRPPHATYVFKHALIQDAAYQSLLKRTRQQYHGQIAQMLAERFAHSAASQPELLAHHYTEAGLHEQAIVYWQRAGEQAIARSANLEAIGHLTKGLTLLEGLPATPERSRQERTLYLTLGTPLIATKGFAAPEVERLYAHALERSQPGQDIPQMFATLRGLYICYVVRGACERALELAEQLLELAGHLPDPAFPLLAHYGLGQTLFLLGALTRAREHLARGLGLYDPVHHRTLAFRYVASPGVTCRSYGAATLGLLGYPDQAQQWHNDALARARELSQPFNLAFALIYAAGFHQRRQEVQLVQKRAEAAIALASEQGFSHWLAHGKMLRGWALTAQGYQDDGIAQMRQGIHDYRATGAQVQLPYYLGLLAEAYGNMGQVETGLHALSEALTLADASGERWYEAELHRLKGELWLMLSLDHHADAVACLQNALSLARRQQAKTLELRAAMSLSRLWQAQGKRQDARELLAPIYHWFTEGFDTADLQEAKALLEALG